VVWYLRSSDVLAKVAILLLIVQMLSLGLAAQFGEGAVSGLVVSTEAIADRRAQVSDFDLGKYN
jgi:hypothetical protein